MSRFALGLVIAGCAAGLLCAPARADIIYSISPATVDATAGDVGDSFDVLLTNTGASAISVAAFDFEVQVTDSDITLTGADFNTGATPYIFPLSDSFVALNSLTLNFTSGSYLDGSDATNDATDVTVGAGDTVALGDVLFNVAAGATPGPFAVAFSCTPTPGVLADCNNLADAEGDLISVDTFDSGTIQISSTSAVPEPSTALPLAAALLAATVFVRKRRRSA